MPEQILQDKLAFIREDMEQLRETKLFNNIRTMDSPRTPGWSWMASACSTSAPTTTWGWPIIPA